MKRSILTAVISAVILAAAQPGIASDVTGLTSFTAGTPAVASQVNGNFTAVKTAVDNNHGRINTLEGIGAGPRLSTLEANAANPSITGNITLAPSTATTGNILKGTAPFLHDYGTGNTFLGLNAGNFTMTGASNTASGTYALVANTTGNNNTASGGYALYSNTTGWDNTASGGYALYSNTTGTSNTASGTYALVANTTGNFNTASGAEALYNNTTGNFNTASGRSALFSNTTGANNIALGTGAGSIPTTGNYNIAIGNSGLVGDSGTIRIGTAANQTRTFIAGIRGVTTGNANAINVVIDSAGQLGTISSSRRVKDDIADMGAASKVLMQLRPVTFHYKSDRSIKNRALQYGLIAEEVAEVAPGLVAHSARGEIETVYYQHLTPMLLNEYQKQQRLIETQTALLAKQTARVAALEKQGQEIVALKQELARMAAVLARLGQPEKVASAGR